MVEEDTMRLIVTMFAIVALFGCDTGAGPPEFETFDALENCLSAGYRNCEGKNDVDRCEALIVGWCETQCEDPDADSCTRWF